jgi:hypothetical protein
MFAARRPSAARTLPATAQQITAASQSSAALLLARMHRLALRRRNQSVDLLMFLLMNFSNARLLLRRRERRVGAYGFHFLTRLL